MSPIPPDLSRALAFMVNHFQLPLPARDEVARMSEDAEQFSDLPEWVRWLLVGAFSSDEPQLDVQEAVEKMYGDE